MCLAGVGRDQKFSWTDVGTDACAAVRRIDEIIRGNLLEKRHDIWKRSVPRGKYESLQEEKIFRQFGRSSRSFISKHGS